MIASLALALLQSSATPQEEVGAWVNGIRMDQNLGPLKRNALLDLAAQRYAAELAREGRFSHTDSRQQGPGERVRDAGYRNFERIAENLALNSKDAEQTVEMWMESPSHRQALLNGTFREMGVGKAEGAEGPIWVWIGGSRFDDYPVMIELDMPSTNRNEVVVWASGAQHASRLRWRWNEASWSPWAEPYNYFRVPLIGATGDRRIQVEYQMRNGSVVVASDEIQRTQ